MGFDVGSGPSALGACTRSIQAGTYFRQSDDTQELLKETEWQAVEDRRQEAETPLFEAVQEMFRAQKERVLSAIDDDTFRVPESEEALREDEPQTTETETVLTAEHVFGLATAVSEARDITIEHARRIIGAGWEVAQERLNADTPFNPDNPKVQQAIADLNEKARGIATTTRDRINDTIAQGIADNKSVGEIRDDIDAEFGAMINGRPGKQSRARTIASTTTTTAFERGQQASFESAGMFGGMWLSQRDVHVRSGHLVADGQTVPIGEPFEVACRAGGSTEELAHPGDPTGSPCNVINCRCTVLPVPDAETFEKVQGEEPDLSNLPQMNDA